jgi:hypothetical protein
MKSLASLVAEHCENWYPGIGAYVPFDRCGGGDVLSEVILEQPKIQNGKDLSKDVETLDAIIAVFEAHCDAVVEARSYASRWYIYDNDSVRNAELAKREVLAHMKKLRESIPKPIVSPYPAAHHAWQPDEEELEALERFRAENEAQWRLWEAVKTTCGPLSAQLSAQGGVGMRTPDNPNTSINTCVYCGVRIPLLHPTEFCRPGCF